MGSRVKRGMTAFIFSFFFCLSAQIHAQEPVAPLDIPLYLSGNFGELRDDHFHSGLDIKTQGVTGQPVRAVKSGYISRISVSPGGYGRAVYINHPDGTTSVYGHLERFASKMESAVLFYYNRDNEYKEKGIELSIPKGNLYTDVYLNPNTTQTASSDFAPLYSFGKRIPLHSFCPITLTVTNDSYPDKSKYGIVSIVDNRAVWLGGKYAEHKIKTRIRELGQFIVAIDTIPPEIIPLNPSKWEINKRIAFKISDELSGIDFYQGRLDGKFVLFEYDAKTHSLFCNFDAQRMKEGKQTLTFLSFVVALLCFTSC